MINRDIRWVRTIAAALIVVLVVFRLASPYFHTHSIDVHGVTEVHPACASCDLESTPLSDMWEPVIAPSHLNFILAAASSPNVEGVAVHSHNTIELRGPPQRSL
ncbi:MAG: hypothetical protein JSS75_08340 [Bacteroidetes bacterium]|nr:hypothetical protein [Bacteroidota bacterium]